MARLTEREPFPHFSVDEVGSRIMSYGDGKICDDAVRLAKVYELRGEPEFTVEYHLL